MRKFLVIASIVMISAAAHAAPVQLAADDTTQAQPAPEAAAPPLATPPAATAPAPAAAEAPAAAPAAEPAKAAETKPVDAKKSKPRPRVARESDEHKARRIAAKYGVYW